jgi:hypothetical protein
MTDQTKALNFTEAPASWNVRYNLGGYDCQLTLRGENGTELLTRAQAALKWLSENGAQATPSKPTNGNGHANGKPQEAPKLDNGQPDPAWCTIHGEAMSRREKDGKVWYSHKIGENEYCKGKTK